LAEEVNYVENPEAIEKYIEEASKYGSSDLHLKSGSPPMIRRHGTIAPLCEDILTEKFIEEFLRKYTDISFDEFLSGDTAYDFSITLCGIRLRGNAYKDLNGINVALRLLIIIAQDFESLGIPSRMKDVIMRTNGLVLITGPTGSGKSTTLTALINYINNTRHAHIITIEDPIEFIHKDINCIISQREVGKDTESFSLAIREAMREDPDIIMVGEMRDKESIEAALQAAETGHLVLATLHTRGAVNSITRIVDVFPANQQDQIRTLLGMTLIAVLSQQLIPGLNTDKRYLATEYMCATDPVKSIIRTNKLHLLASTIQMARSDGMYTMSASLDKLFLEGKISEEMKNRFKF